MREASRKSAAAWRSSSHRTPAPAVLSWRLWKPPRAPMTHLPLLPGWRTHFPLPVCSACCCLALDCASWSLCSGFPAIPYCSSGPYPLTLHSLRLPCSPTQRSRLTPILCWDPEEPHQTVGELWHDSKGPERIAALRYLSPHPAWCAVPTTGGYASQ